MQPTIHLRGSRRLALAGACLFGVLFLLFLAPAPAAAQLDPGSRWAMTTGHWSRGAADTPAWVDLDGWVLVARFDGTTPAFDPEPQPWVPVAGDFDGDGVDEVVMFETATWRTVPLAKGPVESKLDPEPQPWVPVAGDWDGRGVDTIRVVDLRDRSVHRLEEGPTPVERYDPEPSPWMPLAGDWDGKGVDTIAWVHADGAAGAWQPVAGDWDGRGVDTVAAVHRPTGELVLGSPATALSSPATASFDKSLGGGKGCYTVIKNQVGIVKVFYGLDGSVTVIHIKYHEEWTCCPIDQWGLQYVCGKKIVAG